MIYGILLTPLGTSPRASEGGLVDVELGLAQAAAADGARGVRGLLEDGLRRDELVDERAEGGVGARRVLVDDGLEHERGVTGPGVRVVGVTRAGAGDDDTGLRKTAEKK